MCMSILLPSLSYLIHLPEGLDKVQISELVQVNKCLKNFDVEIIPEGQKHRETRLKMLLHVSHRK